jgi:hypothetical protein
LYPRQFGTSGRERSKGIEHIIKPALRFASGPVPVLAELAQEQTWSNFKNQAADYAGGHGSEYIDALHRVWSVMHRLQD